MYPCTPNEVTSQQPILYPDNTLQPIGLFDTPYGQYVADHLSPATAGRIEECATMHVKHMDVSGHLWLMVYYCGKRSCKICAGRIADEGYRHYEVLAQDDFKHLAYFETDNPKVIKVLARLGMTLACESGQGFRGMLLESIYSISSTVLSKLRTLDPGLLIRGYSRDRFHKMLKKVFEPFIPTDFGQRLLLEKRRRRVIFVGASQDKRKELKARREARDAEEGKVTGNIHNTDNFPSVKVPHCPKCGSPSIRHTQCMKIGTPLHEERWMDTFYSSPPGDSPPENLC